MPAGGRSTMGPHISSRPPENSAYEKLDEYLDFGGIRIEDNVLITEDSYRILGKPIAKSVKEVEELRSS